MSASPDLAVVLASLADGGVGRNRVRLVNELARRGYRIDLLMADRDSRYVRALSETIRVVELPTSHALFSLPSLVRYLRRERPAVVLSQRVRVNVATLRARRLARSAVPVYTTLNTNLTAQLASMRARKRAKQLRQLRTWYPRNDGLIAVSHGVAEDAARLIGVPRARIPVARNPTITPDIAARMAEPLDHPWFAAGEPPVVLGLGRLQPQKDFPTLLQAFARLRADRPARLVILGEGPERAALLAQACELGIDQDLALPGFVDNPYAWMHRAALFALSSRWEGSPNGLTEALAAGLPAVATDCPDGPREILDGGHYGPLVPVGDSSALADAMLTTLANPLPAETLREAVRAYTVEASADQYIAAMGLGR